MKKALLFFLVLSSSFCFGQSIDTNSLNRYLDSLQVHEKFMGSVGILKDGSLVYQKAAGYAMVQGEAGQLANSDTKYRIGSITKVFTAVLILQMVEEEKLELNQSIETFFPGLTNADKITVRHLLEHTSGLENLTAREDYMSFHTRAFTREELMKDYIHGNLEFKPGDQFKYSNTGYILLGFILEDLNGKSYADLIEERISKKLGLESTYVGSTINALYNEAQSYNYRGRWAVSSETHSSIPGAAGNIVSSSKDLLRFLDALFHEELISDESLALMQEMEEGNYGLGLMRAPYYDQWGYGHNGGIDGFRSMAYYFPEMDLGVCLLSNALNYDLNQMSIKLIQAGLGDSLSIPSFQAPKLSADQLNPCAGTFYTDLTPLEIKFWVSEGSLFAQATGQSSFSLTPVSETEFKFEAAQLRIIFKDKKKGKYQSMTLIQGGELLFKRKK